MRNPSARLACAALLLAATSACGDARREAPGARVAVTLPPLAWFVERLLEDQGSVASLLPPGANPHSFEPGLAEVRAAGHASVLVTVGHAGLPFERSAAAALADDHPGIVTVAAAPPEALARPDPHVWLSPRIARAMAERIAGALAAAFPADAIAIRERQGPLDAEIAGLDRAIGERLAPFRGRAFLSVHPDWSAFAADYGLRELTLERGHREPDAAALAARIEDARRERVRALFIQPQYSRESADLVAGEIGAEVVSIDPLARDWPGTLRAMTDALTESFTR
ncbi:MAG TPA: zinc ABC transporter substrate-binding protein [Myxococcota bacterium]|nr:zinc ABC transporter substrate-binding protein [Myxococcota bacterium]